jgi:uncharacterized protein (TIGR03067 family)
MTAAFIVAVSLLAAQDTKKDLEKLQGTWTHVGGEEQGKKVDEIKGDPIVLVFKGDKLSWKRGKEEKVMTVKLHPDMKPAGIDLIIPKEKINHAIYAVDGDKLTIRIDNKFKPNEPKDRPTDFSQEKFKGDHQLLFIFKREKK